MGGRFGVFVDVILFQGWFVGCCLGLVLVCWFLV